MTLSHTAALVCGQSERNWAARQEDLAHRCEALLVHPVVESVSQASGCQRPKYHQAYLEIHGPWWALVFQDYLSTGWPFVAHHHSLKNTIMVADIDTLLWII